MEWRCDHGRYDFMVPTGKDGFEVINPSTEDWFQWGVSGFEKESLAKLSSDTRISPVKESKVPQFHMGEGSSSSSPCEDDLLFDYSMRTSDDLFDDLPDFEIQNSSQNMDDIFLDSFPVEDLMHLGNPYESMHTSNSMNPPWNWRISMLEDSDTLMKDLSASEDAVREDPNFETAYSVDPSQFSESLITAAEDEPVCIKATVLQELENVMLQLDGKTRICIRDALYRLANSSKEHHNINLYQSGSFMDFPSYSEHSCGTSRKELSRSHELKTNAIDRAIAALMFDRPDYRIPEFQSSAPFFKNKETEAASGS